MKFQVKENAKSIKSRIILAIFALFGGTGVAMLSQLGFFLMPLLSAPLAVLFLSEVDTKRIFSIATPIAVVLIDFLFNFVYSFNCVSAVLVAVIIYLALRYGFLAKSESAILSLVVASLIAVISFLMLGCYFVGSFDLGRVMESYTELVSEYESVWVDLMRQYVLADETGELAAVLTDEVEVEMYRAAVNSAFSILVVAVFLAIGLTYKLFERMLVKRSAFPEAVCSWRFTLTPVYAVFFIVLSILSLFSEGDAFGIVISNLTTVFTFIFAYLGYLFASAFLRLRTRIRSVRLLLVVAILMFSSTAVSILSYVGVFATFMLDRAEKNGTNTSGGNSL